MRGYFARLNTVRIQTVATAKGAKDLYANWKQVGFYYETLDDAQGGAAVSPQEDFRNTFREKTLMF